jgi:putative transposase
MKRKRFSPKQTIRILNKANYGISEQTFYNWRIKYGDMPISDARRLKVLDEENLKLRHLVADLSLDNRVLKELLEKNFYYPKQNVRLLSMHYHALG